ncbi:MAG: hypothetical protein EOO45_21910 [Flavobacterium sp.]|nr:MAG: hypothetical protein EOO45_21910 [Flavobacterium sp.]
MSKQTKPRIVLRHFRKRMVYSDKKFPDRCGKGRKDGQNGMGMQVPRAGQLEFRQKKTCTRKAFGRKNSQKTPGMLQKNGKIRLVDSLENGKLPKGMSGNIGLSGFGA